MINDFRNRSAVGLQGHYYDVPQPAATCAIHRFLLILLFILETFNGFTARFRLFDILNYRANLIQSS